MQIEVFKLSNRIWQMEYILLVKIIYNTPIQIFLESKDKESAILENLKSVPFQKITNYHLICINKINEDKTMLAVGSAYYYANCNLQLEIFLCSDVFQQFFKFNIQYTHNMYNKEIIILNNFFLTFLNQKFINTTLLIFTEKYSFTNLNNN